MDEAADRIQHHFCSTYMRNGDFFHVLARDRVRNSKVWVQIYPDFFTPTPNLWVQEPLSRKSVGAAAPTAPTLTRSLQNDLLL